VPCEVDLASEFRYRDPVVGPGDLVIAISQSGETADTLAGGQGSARARRPRPGDLQRRRFGDPALVARLAVHATRARDRRRVDEVLHGAAGGAGAGGDPPRAAAPER
jgi:hypothetical protein